MKIDAVRAHVRFARVPKVLLIGIIGIGCLITQMGCIQSRASEAPENLGTECEEAKLDERGNPILPSDAEDVTNMDLSAGEVTGTVHDLYGDNFDTSLDTWYGVALADPKFPCPSTIGAPASLPVDPAHPLEAQDTAYLDEINKAGDEIYSVADASPCAPSDGGKDEAADIVQIGSTRFCLPAITISGSTYLEPLCPGRDKSKSVDCKTLIDTSNPFDGRDIIFIHGLDLGPVFEKVTGSNSFQWPIDKAEFYGNGHFKQRAQDYWDSHIQHFLVQRSATNRYLLASYTSTQRVPVAAHAVLTQIADAMSPLGTDVVFKNNDPRGKTGFCVGGCIIISHSTGALVSDVMLTVAMNTNQFGDLRFIPNHIKVSIALDGAFSGSPFATAAIAVGMGIALSPQTCLTAMTALNIYALTQGLSLQINCGMPFNTIVSSVLLDLVPAMAHNKWGPLVAMTPVPVLLVSGGHPTHYYPAKYFLHPGFDAGVVPMDSSCAKRSLPLIWPTGSLPASIALLKLYDLGGNSVRSVPYFIEQTSQQNGLPNRVSAACIPWKTPWGMLQPVAPLPGSGTSQGDFYPNHYCLIQAAADHSAIVDGGDPETTWGSLTGIENNEETRCVVSSDVYMRGLVRSSFMDSQIEVVKGLKVEFNRKILGIKIHFVWWIWKRTYHLLDGWESQSVGDYLYDIVRGT